MSNQRGQAPMVWKYYGIVKAESGLLLGGVKEHRSCGFDTREDAQQWLEAILEGNKQAHRKVGYSDVGKYLRKREVS